MEKLKLAIKDLKEKQEWYACANMSHYKLFRKEQESCEKAIEILNMYVRGELVEASESNCTIHGVRLSLPTIRDMYDEAYGRYTQPTQEHMKNAFMEGAKWCRDITKELSEQGNEA